MQSKWAKTTAQRIASGELAEPIIRKARALLRDAVNAEEYFKREPSPSATAAEAWELVDMISTHAPRVTDAQARKGAEWLRRLVYTSRGTVRRTEAAQQFTAADLRVLQACIARPSFRLVELDPHSDGRYLRDLAPVYRCIGDNGESFDYTASAWQSGGAFAILRHCDPLASVRDHIARNADAFDAV